MSLGENTQHYFVYNLLSYCSSHAIHEEQIACVKTWSFFRKNHLPCSEACIFISGLDYFVAQFDLVLKYRAFLGSVFMPLLYVTKWAASWQNQQNGCAPSEDSDQPGHPPSLIIVFAVRMKKAWVLSYQKWVHSEDSDQTGRMLRLIWVFAGRTVTLLVLSCRGSNRPVF